MSRNDKALYIILGLFLITTIFLLQKTQIIQWDEAAYIGMGKYIFSTGQSGLWEPLRPIIIPFLFGILWKANLSMPLFAQLLSLLFSIGTVALTYIIAKQTFGRPAAVIASALLAFTPIFFENSILALTGTPSTFFALLGLYYFTKQKYTIAGLILAIGFLTRFPQGLVFIALLIIIIYQWLKSKTISKEQILKFKLSFAIPVVLFLVLNYFLYSDTSTLFQAVFKPFILGAAHQTNPAHAVESFGPATRIYNYLFYPLELIRQNPALLFAIPGIAFVFINKKIKSLPVLAVLSLLTLLMLYFTLIINKQVRFALVFLPFLTIFAGYGVVQLYRTAMQRASSVRIASIIAIIAVLLVSGLAVGAQNLDIYNSLPDKEPEIASEVYKYFENSPDAVVLTTDPRIAPFTNARIIPFYFSPQEGIEIYDESISQATHVLYHPEFFPCELYGPDCEAKKAELFRRIQSENKEVFHEDYGYAEYFIYS